MKVEFLTPEQASTMALTDFLVGYSGMSAKLGIKKRLASPIAAYIKAVDKFLFSGGWVFDVANTTQEDTRTELLNQVIKSNRLEPLSNRLWERGATSGSLLFWIRPAPEPVFYRLWMLDPSEYKFQNETWYIQTESDKPRYFQRWGITDTDIIKFKETKFEYSHWEEESREPHGYPEAPVYEILNDQYTSGGPGIPEFDGLALTLAAEIMLQSLTASESYYFFGQPKFVAADPQEVLQKLQERSQVLQGTMDREQQDLSVLTFPSMPADHPEFVKGLQREFNRHMGISLFTDEAPRDVASVTLRTLASDTLRVAQRKALFYIDYGLEPLLEKVLKLAAYDGVITTVRPNDTSTFDVTISKKEPDFPETPQEKLVNIEIGQALIGLGVEPSVALSQVYPQKTSEEIDQLLVGS